MPLYKLSTHAVVYICFRGVLNSVLLVSIPGWNPAVLHGSMSGTVFWDQLFICMEAVPVVQG